MVQVIIQPAANDLAFEHYLNTVLNKVSLTIIAPNVDANTFLRLKNIYGESDVAVWGVEPGENNITRNKWAGMHSGDIVLFYRHNRIMATAVVTMKMLSEQLAIELWKIDVDGATWECIYFLKEVKKTNIDFVRVRNAAGYNPNYNPQAFNVLNAAKSSAVIRELNL